MLYFVLGGVYTILMVIAGFLVGYYYKRGYLPESKVINNLTNKLTNKLTKKDDAGPVKPITKLEREAEEKKGFTDRVKDLITD